VVVPKSKKTQELDSLHLIIPGVQVVKETNIWKTSVLVQKTQELNSLHLIILFVQVVKENHILQT
jgi:hypothetical protein